MAVNVDNLTEKNMRVRPSYAQLDAVRAVCEVYPRETHATIPVLRRRPPRSGQTWGWVAPGLRGKIVGVEDDRLRARMRISLDRANRWLDRWEEF